MKWRLLILTFVLAFGALALYFSPISSYGPVYQDLNVDDPPRLKATSLVGFSNDRNTGNVNIALYLSPESAGNDAILSADIVESYRWSQQYYLSVACPNSAEDTCRTGRTLIVIVVPATSDHVCYKPGQCTDYAVLVGMFLSPSHAAKLVNQNPDSFADINGFHMLVAEDTGGTGGNITIYDDPDTRPVFSGFAK